MSLSTHPGRLSNVSAAGTWAVSAHRKQVGRKTNLNEPFVWEKLSWCCSLSRVVHLSPTKVEANDNCCLIKRVQTQRNAISLSIFKGDKTSSFVETIQLKNQKVCSSGLLTHADNENGNSNRPCWLTDWETSIFGAKEMSEPQGWNHAVPSVQPEPKLS